MNDPDPVRTMTTKAITVDINGEGWEGEVPVDLVLLDLLRDRLRMTGSKRGCDAQVCGACTVLVEDQPVSACTYLAFEVDGRAVRTVEGLATDDLTPLQDAFVRNVALQCGYCTAGQLMTCTAMLERHAHPDDATIDSWLRGHLCRCGTYPAIRTSIHEVAAQRAGR